MQSIQYLNDHFISLPNIVGYIVAAALAWWLGNWIVGRHQTKLQGLLVEHNLGLMTVNITQELTIRRRSLASQLAVKIGRLEKLIYILAVMVDKYGLVTAIVILKAFFGWINVPPDPVQGRERSDILDYYYYRQDFYYVYISGNVLSVFVGLALGFVGKIVAAFANDLIGYIIPLF